MPFYITFFLSTFIFIGSCQTLQNPDSDSEPISHEQWTALLEKHVTDKVFVDYQGFREDSNQLDAYLEKLSSHHPNEKHWSEKERLAYWINAYNAFTIELVLKHYPVESIKDVVTGLNITFVNSPWDIKFIEIEGEEYDLNNLEHDIMRERFEEPRIHFAINCASVSCPRLIDEAYKAGKLDEQLDRRAKAFINDTNRNRIQEDQIEISRIFRWFKGDFTKNGSLIDYLNKYSETFIDEDASINYMDYDWRLNDANKELSQK